MRQLGLEYATSLKSMSAAELKDVQIGLQLGDGSGTGNAACTPTLKALDAMAAAPKTKADGFTQQSAAAFATTYYVNAATGSDTNAGTSPTAAFKTVNKAAAAAAAAGVARPVGVMLDTAAPHYLPSTLELGPEHSGVTFTSMSGGSAMISAGATMEGLAWRRAAGEDEWFKSGAMRGAGDQDVLIADVAPGLDFIDLFLNGARMTRARYPNGRANSGGVYPNGYALGTYSGKDAFKGTVVKDKTCRSDDTNPFPCQSFIAGGPGQRYDPPSMFNDPDDLAMVKPTGFSMDGGGGMMAGPASTWSNVDQALMQTFVVDTGGAALLRKNKKRAKQNRSAFAETPRMKAFAAKKATGMLGDPTDDVLPQWGGWWAALNSRKAKKVTFKEQIDQKGMWQDQAQTADDGDAGAFFVENIKEELDAPNEWYLDTSAGKLYFKGNNTEAMLSGAANANTEFVYSRRNFTTLVHIQGGKQNPVTDVAFEGITFAHSEPTVMRQYMIPSCGDWAIYKGGAVYIEGGSERLRFDSNTFGPLGGNALFAHGYMKDSNITNNEFKWVGDSAIAFLGRAALHDATGGFYPQDNIVMNNHAHETGIFDIESSFFFEAISGHNQVVNNVMYNGPRAAINYNDGGVGGTILRGNLIFGHGRESSDHGPINSWDRCPFKTLRGAKPGVANWLPAERYISKNYVMNGGILFDCITHDDGASYYTDTTNVLLYGGSQNNNAYFNSWEYNLIVQPHINSNYPMPGYDAFNYDADATGNSVTGNTVVMKGHACADVYGSGVTMDFDDASFPENSSDTTVYNDNGDWTVYTNCDPTGVGCFHGGKALDTNASVGKGSCKTYTIAAWNKQGYDKGSKSDSISKMSNANIVAAANTILKTNAPSAKERGNAAPSWSVGSTIDSAVIADALVAKEAREGAASGYNACSGDCTVWQQFWKFSNGPYWTQCNTTAAMTAPCSCSMVKCSGTEITEINVQGATGVQGPLNWLMDGRMSKLTKVTAGNELTIVCSKGASPDANKGAAGWTCAESK